MIELSKFVKEHRVLCVCTFGTAIPAYLSYRLIRLIIKKCSQTERINSVSHHISIPITVTSHLQDFNWSHINKSNEFLTFKKYWESLVSEYERNEFAFILKHSYKPFPLNGRKSIYNEPIGLTLGVPENYNLWMPGIALVAAYLSEKKQVEGLFVCETLESLSFQIEKVHLNPIDQRFAFIVGVLPLGKDSNFPQHKVTVCVEKIEGKVTILLLDAQPMEENTEIRPQNLQNDNLNAQELVFKAILTGCYTANKPARLLHSQVLRQVSYGCAVFALQDSLAFLQDHECLNKIRAVEKIKINEQYELEVITHLPPEFMIGTQSARILHDYRAQYAQYFELPLIGKKKTLEEYLNTYCKSVNGRIQNHFITNKYFKYLYLAVLTLRYLPHSEAEKIINKTLL